MRKKRKIIISRLLPSRPDKSDCVSKLQELLIKEEGVEKESVDWECVGKTLSIHFYPLFHTPATQLTPSINIAHLNGLTLGREKRPILYTRNSKDQSPAKHKAQTQLLLHASTFIEHLQITNQSNFVHIRLLCDKLGWVCSPPYSVIHGRSPRKSMYGAILRERFVHLLPLHLSWTPTHPLKKAEACSRKDSSRFTCP